MLQWLLAVGPFCSSWCPWCVCGFSFLEFGASLVSPCRRLPLCWVPLQHSSLLRPPLCQRIAPTVPSDDQSADPKFLGDYSVHKASLYAQLSATLADECCIVASSVGLSETMYLRAIDLCCIVSLPLGLSGAASEPLIQVAS